jgi:hypothetical protein
MRLFLAFLWLSGAGSDFVLFNIIIVILIIFFLRVLFEKKTLVLICKATLGGRKALPLGWVAAVMVCKNTYQ